MPWRRLAAVDCGAMTAPPPAFTQRFEPRYVEVKKLPGLRLAPGRSITYLPNFLHRGPRTLQVEWDPA